MSSLRNAVKRITHKERSQPRNRSQLGILEKKKDYKERAQDYHRKEDRLKAMRERASLRNPDEFYFGMKNAQVKDGKHKKTRAVEQKEFDKEIGTDTIKLLKNQDLSYIRMQKQRDAKKAEKLQATLHIVENKKRKHTVFVGSQEEADNLDLAEHFDTRPELIGRSFNRIRNSQIEAKIAETDGLSKEEVVNQVESERKTARKLLRARESAYRELKERQKRVKKLENAEAHLMTEKFVSGKGRKRKIAEASNGKPAQYKWRRKRLG